MAKEKKAQIPKSTTKDLMCGLMAAEADQFLHPVDTIIKIIQNSPIKINNWETFKQVAVLSNLNSIQSDALTIPYDPMCRVNNKVANKEILSKLFNGFGYAALNKGLTRTYRYMTQSYMQESLKKIFEPLRKNYIDEKKAQTFYGGASGVLSGISETLIFHPFDTKKTRKQLGTKVGTGMYSGLNPALIRSAASGGIFFSAYNYFIEMLKKHEQPTNIENFIASTAAGLTTALATNPIEVIKTRLQGQDLSKPGVKKVGMLTMFKKVVMEGGVKALTKGSFLKCIQSPVKTGLPFFAYTYAKKLLDENNKNQQELKKELKK